MLVKFDYRRSVMSRRREKTQGDHRGHLCLGRYSALLARALPNPPPLPGSTHLSEPLLSMAAALATAQAASAARPACGAARRPQPFRSSSAAAAPARSHRAQLPQLRRRAAGPPPARSLSDEEAASLQAVQELDALIDVLLAKKNPQDLAQTVRWRPAVAVTATAWRARQRACRCCSARAARCTGASHRQSVTHNHAHLIDEPQVAENIMSFDQRFWLRVATRADAAADDEAKQQLAALAKVGRRAGDAGGRQAAMHGGWPNLPVKGGPVSRCCPAFRATHSSHCSAVLTSPRRLCALACRPCRW